MGWSARVAAWVIACEGCITLGQESSHKYNPCVKMDNTSEELIKGFRELVGYGGIGGRSYIRNGGNSKPFYYWQLSSQKDIGAFLRWVLPYLPIKKEQAELLTEFCERKEKYKKNTPYTERERWIYQRMKELNHRGLIKEVQNGVEC